MRIWRVFDDETLELVPDVGFEEEHLEKDLESWVAHPGYTHWTPMMNGYRGGEIRSAHEAVR
jgi:hypothetical protein